MRINSYHKSYSFLLKHFLADFSWAFHRVCRPFNPTYWKDAIRFSVLTLLNPFSSASWFHFLRENEFLAEVVVENKFIDRVHRPFLDKRFSTSERIQFLQSHFTILASLLTKQQTGLVMSGEGITLAHLTGKSNQQITIKLLRSVIFDKEGGATLELSMDGLPILMLTFTLMNQRNGFGFMIGGIQSKEYPETDSRALLRDLTHALHGIQPRILMLDALRFIAQQLGCASIECISEANHIYRALRYRRNKIIHAQYNQLWELVGGHQLSNGNFAIPSSVEEKPIESRPSKKRNEYRQRGAILHSLRTQIGEEIFLPGLADHGLPASQSPSLLTSTTPRLFSAPITKA